MRTERRKFSKPDLAQRNGASMRASSMSPARGVARDDRYSTAAIPGVVTGAGGGTLGASMPPQVHELVNAPLPDRSLPPLKRALSSPEIRATPPEQLYPVPQAIVDRLAQAKKVLVIGHVPPDGDCVGSALGLARMMRAMGKEAHACIDDDLPGNLRKMDVEGPHCVKRARDLDDDYDLVVIVDVAAANRIGDAAKAVRAAPEVMVIDHHHVEATREGLGIDEKTPLTTWIEPDADSASLLVAGAAAKLGESFRSAGGKIDEKTWSEIALPLAVGAFTDTDGFTRPGATMTALEGYKYLVGHHLHGDGTAVRRVLDYHLPKRAARMLKGPLKMSTVFAAPKHAELRARFDDLIARRVSVGVELARDHSTALITAPHELMDLVLAVAQTDDPDTGMNDVRGFLLHQLDQLPRSYKLAALLFEGSDEILVSTRSRDPGPALNLARAVGSALGGSGNGHLHMAGAAIERNIADTRAMVKDWLAHWALEQEAKARSAGNL